MDKQQMQNDGMKINGDGALRVQTDEINEEGDKISLPNCPLSSNECTHLCIIKLIYLKDTELEIAFALPFKLYSTINYGAQ